MLISQIWNNGNKIIILQGDSGGAIVVASSSSHLGETKKMSLLAVETLYSMQTIGGRGIGNWEGDQPNFGRGEWFLDPLEGGYSPPHPPPPLPTYDADCAEK